MSSRFLPACIAWSCLACVVAASGCCSTCKWKSSSCDAGVCAPEQCGCQSKWKLFGKKKCGDDCVLKGGMKGGVIHGGGVVHARSMAIPDTYPLGSVIRSHYHAMETNGEAADFIFHRNDFLESSAELTPEGKDHLLEIAARMRSAPFPVLVERSEHNADPELDEHRRNLVATVLTDLGNPDAHQRTIVSPAYGLGLNSVEAQSDYYQYLYTRGGTGGNFSGSNGGFGGFGGAGGGGFGFGN